MSVVADWQTRWRGKQEGAAARREVERRGQAHWTERKGGRPQVARQRGERDTRGDEALLFVALILFLSFLHRTNPPTHTHPHTHTHAHTHNHTQPAARFYSQLSPWCLLPLHPHPYPGQLSYPPPSPFPSRERDSRRRRPHPLRRLWLPRASSRFHGHASCAAFPCCPLRVSFRSIDCVCVRVLPSSHLAHPTRRRFRPTTSYANQQ